jgi:hypothetical protein
MGTGLESQRHRPTVPRYKSVFAILPAVLEETLPRAMDIRSEFRGCDVLDPSTEQICWIVVQRSLDATPDGHVGVVFIRYENEDTGLGIGQLLIPQPRRNDRDRGPRYPGSSGWTSSHWRSDARHAPRASEISVADKVAPRCAASG